MVCSMMLEELDLWLNPGTSTADIPAPRRYGPGDAGAPGNAIHPMPNNNVGWPRSSIGVVGTQTSPSNQNDTRVNDPLLGMSGGGAAGGGEGLLSDADAVQEGDWDASFRALDGTCEYIEETVRSLNFRFSAMDAQMQQRILQLNRALELSFTNRNSSGTGRHPSSDDSSDDERRCRPRSRVRFNPTPGGRGDREAMLLRLLAEMEEGVTQRKF